MGRLGFSTPLVCAAGIWCVVCLPVLAAVPPPVQSSNQLRIEETLDQPTECEFMRTPLADAMAVLAQKHRIPIVLDRRALQRAMVEPTTRVTFSIRGVTLESALNLMLRDLQLDWTIAHDVLLITTTESSEQLLLTRICLAGDLVKVSAQPPGDYDSLVEVITSTIASKSWYQMGGPGSVARLIAGGKPMPVISQTARNHRAIARLLRSLRAPDGRPAGDKVLAAEARIEHALGQPASCDFKKMPLNEAVQLLSQTHGIPILIDKRGLAHALLQPNAPVNFSVRGVSLASALDLMLRPLHLTWTITDEVLLITTPEAAEQLLLTRVYPLEKLLPQSAGGQIDYDTLIEVITSTATPQSWEDTGGWGAIAPLKVAGAPRLVIAQTAAVHRRVLRLLCSLAAPDGRTPGDKVLEAEARIEAALSRPAQCAFQETPLDQALEQLSQAHGISILLDKRALEQKQIEPTEPVTLAIREATLESALNLLLRPLDLTWTIYGEVVLVTTPEESERLMITRVYRVGDLLTPDAQQRMGYDELIDAIESIVEAPSWTTMGGPGSIVPFEQARTPTLVISHTATVHRKVARLLGSLAAPGGRAAGDKFLAAETAIEQALGQPTDCEFRDTPLHQALASLAQTHGIPIVLDELALSQMEKPVTATTPVNLSVRGVSLASALRLLLRPLGLVWTIRDTALLVTTPEGAEWPLLVRVYPVGDLVGSESQHQAGFEALIETITSTIEPQTWWELGGPGSIAPADVGSGPKLVIAQTAATHRRIAGFLQELREAIAKNGTVSARNPRGFAPAGGFDASGGEKPQNLRPEGLSLPRQDSLEPGEGLF